MGNTIFGALSGEFKVSYGQFIHEIVDKLVSVLGKKKPTPVSPYLFHLCSKFECLRREEIQKIEVARECLELGIAPEVEPNVEEKDSDRGSLSPEAKQQKQTPSPCSRMKTTFKSPRGKSPVWNPDWKDMRCLDLGRWPFPTGSGRARSSLKSLFQDGSSDQRSFSAPRQLQG